MPCGKDGTPSWESETFKARREIPTWSKQIVHIKEGGYVRVWELRSAGPIQKWSPSFMAEYRLCVARFPFFLK